MIKLLLAEDERYALKSLEQKIADLGGEYQVIGTAANGAQALALMEKERPDIVLTDIRMPGMDGLDLIRRMRTDYPDITAVIISGYQEFEYAKRAMSLSVTNYLLKPVEINELKDCLEQCVLRRRKAQEEKHRDVVSVMKDKTFLDTAFTATGNYTVLYAVAGNPLSSADNIIHPLISGLSSETFEEALRRYFPASSSIYCFDGVFTNEKAVILQTERLNIKSFQLRLTSVTRDLEQKFGWPLSVHIEFLNDQKGIGDSITRCHKAAAAHAQMGRSVVSYAKETGDSMHELSEICEKVITNDLISLLRLLLQQKQYSLIRPNLTPIFEQWEEHSCTIREMQKELVYLLDSLKYSSLNDAVFEFNSQFYVENLFSSSVSYEQLEDNFTSLLTGLFEKTNPPKETSADALIESSIEYFTQNLDSNITMQMLCNKYQVSQVYLCRIFKKQLDMTPIDYFIHMKIDRAKELFLQYPTLPVKDVAEMMGFSDSYYFSKVFKKITGQTPSSFRESNRRE